MIARWWHSQSARERALLMAAGGCAALALIWFAAIAPALGARDQARRAYLTASDLYAEMAEGARTAAALRAAAPDAGAGGSDEPLRAAASLAARDLGLEISRIQPGENGALAFVFDAADPQDLFRWVERLQTRYGAPAATVTMRRNQGARTVQANILVLEAQ